MNIETIANRTGPKVLQLVQLGVHLNGERI